MARTEKSYADVVTGWKELGAGFASNAGKTPHLETHSQELEDVRAQVESLSAQQAVHTAAKQDLTKRIQVLLDEGQKLATFLRVGVRQHYGRDSEKLVEYGLQPFRGIKRPTTTPPPPPVETSPPGEAGPSEPQE
jgi:hypothetical protein